MLILTRRIGEAIVIGGLDGSKPVTLRVGSIDRYKEQVRIMIDAPKEVSINREEIYQRKVGEIDNDGNN